MGKKIVKNVKKKRYAISDGITSASFLVLSFLQM